MQRGISSRAICNVSALFPFLEELMQFQGVGLGYCSVPRLQLNSVPAWLLLQRWAILAILPPAAQEKWACSHQLRGPLSEWALNASLERSHLLGRPEGPGWLEHYSPSSVLYFGSISRPGISWLKWKTRKEADSVPAAKWLFPPCQPQPDRP